MKLTHRRIICILAALIAHITFAAVPADPLPIDLSSAVWYGSRGQQTKAGADDVRITHFPVVLNSIFETPPGSDLQSFTLRTTFHISQGDAALPLAIRLAVVGESWRLFLNGQLLRDEMPALCGGALCMRRSLRGVVIPTGVLLKSGRNELLIHLQGDAPVVSFVPNDMVGFYMNKGYEVDLYSNIVSRYSEWITLSITGVYAFAGLYLCALYSMRRTVRYHLNFGLFSLLVAAYTFMRTDALFLVFPGSSTSMLVRLEYTFLFLLLPAAVLFVNEYFQGGGRLPFPLRVVFAVSGVMALGALAAPFPFIHVILRIWQLWAVLLLLGIIGLLITFMIKRREDAGIMAFLIALTIMTAIWDIYASASHFSDVRFAQYTFTGLTFAVMFLMARRSVNIEKREEDLRDELTEVSAAFFRFVPVQVMQELNKTSAADLDVGESVEKKMTVLFSDIRGFTALSETMSHDDLFHFMNSYLRRMEPALQQYGGFVDKFIGDAIMALFSEVEWTDKKSGRALTSADRSVYAAVAMLNELTLYNGHRSASGYAPIRIGVGINTGQLTLGTVGTSNRIDTTAVGNTVNIASRLEALTSHFQVNLMISEYSYLDLTAPDDFRVREVGSMLVKGKTEPVVVYEVYNADPPEIAAKKDAADGPLAKGLSLFRQRDFPLASASFKDALKVFPEDTVSRAYVELCKMYEKASLPDTWQGNVEILHK